MISIQEALALIEAECEPLTTRRVPLEDALGLVLAEDVSSDIDSPPHDKALMDGYAVRTRDGNAERRILGQITAGEIANLVVSPGTAVRIMTGAPIPQGADAVVMFELTEAVDSETVRFLDPSLTRGQHIMPRGQSLRRGQVVLQSGTVIHPAEIGILAEIGGTLPRVVPRPRVAVLATGNELVPADQRPTNGLIRNSNGPMLSAAVAASGATPNNLGIVGDDRTLLQAMIEKGLTHDIVILSGGVSAGVLDLVPPVLEGLGVRKVFHQVKMKPGKPTWFGVREDDRRGSLVFGIPGNPVSGFVCFQLLVRPAIRALGGHGFEEGPRCRARLEQSIHITGDRPLFHPCQVRTDGNSRTVIPVSYYGSADLAALASTNGFIVLPAGNVELGTGDEVEVVERLGMLG